MMPLRALMASLLFAAATAIAITSPANALERGTFGWRSAEVVGTRPLLVIWMREPDETPPGELAKYSHYFSDIVFGTGTDAGTGAAAAAGASLRYEPSVAGYYREVSGGKFAWRRAGLIGPLTVSIKGKKPDEIARLALQSAATEGGFDFRPFGANGDRHIAPEALAVLVLVNSGASLHWQDFTAAGKGIAIADQGVAFAGRVALAGENDNLSAFNRELFHVIAPDAADLDGWPQKCFALNRGYTLMAAVNSSNPRQTVHLDPWHKMMVGWTEPRVVAIGKAGSAKLAAQHLAPPAEKRPLVIYDGMKGPSEFFLLEYRTRSPLGFDQDVGNSGLVIWHVMLDRANHVFKVPADRKNCKGETLPVQSLFVRGAPDWLLGSGRAYYATVGPITLKWMDGTDTGVQVSVVTAHKQLDPTIEVAWTARSGGAVAGH